MLTLTVAVPAYSRPNELDELCESIYNGEMMPDEVLICEDFSPLRKEINEVAFKWKPLFEDRFIRFNYIENEENLGYDKNIRNLLTNARGDYVLILGDDDMLTVDCIGTVKSYIQQNPNIPFISRTFTRFDAETKKIINTTWLSTIDCVFNNSEDNAAEVMRLCGFVGGIIVDRVWANKLSTDQFDGGLYYQFYLACKSYKESGIGYISKAIVFGRAGNPPLFGHAISESSVHVPGSYRPKGRYTMWKSILDISKFVYGDGIFLQKMKKELANRQSFHVFEMMPIQGRSATLELYSYYRLLGISFYWLPIFATLTIVLFGRHSLFIFNLIRNFQFYIERNFKLKL
jgi:glycosyltransferase involved in cell wall biosynthesis